MGVSGKYTEDPKDLNVVHVFYTEYTISARGKVLITDMYNSREVQIYYWQAKQEPIDYLTQTVRVGVFNYLPYQKYFMFGGTTNYVRGYGEETNKNVNWMNTKRTFGYMQVWTTNEVCYTNEDKLLLNYGPRFSTYADGLDDILLIKMRAEADPVRTAPFSHNIGNLDDPDFQDRLLEQQRIDKDGFYVEYIDWEYEDFDKQEFRYKQFDVDGRNWVDRFNKKTRA